VPRKKRQKNTACRCGPCAEPSRTASGAGSRHIQIGGLSDGLGRPGVGRVNDVVEVVAHGDKQVEEELPASLAVHVAAALFHLGLHGAAALERLAAADDEGQVVGA
jgi:hypothetical protein